MTFLLDVYSFELTLTLPTFGPTRGHSLSHSFVRFPQSVGLQYHVLHGLQMETQPMATFHCYARRHTSMSHPAFI